MRYPSDVYSVFGIDVIDEVSQCILNLPGEGEKEVAISEAITAN